MEEVHEGAVALQLSAGLLINPCGPVPNDVNKGVKSSSGLFGTLIPQASYFVGLGNSRTINGLR